MLWTRSSTELSNHSSCSKVVANRLPQTSKRILGACAAFGFALAVFGQGINAPFAGPQEPLQAQLIQDTLLHRHWLVAFDCYGMMNLKPPLYSWLSALIARVARSRKRSRATCHCLLLRRSRL